MDNPGPGAAPPAVTSSPGESSVMTTSSLDFSFASPVPENLRQESRQEESMSMTLSGKKEQREPEASNAVSLVQEKLCVNEESLAAIDDESSGLQAPIDSSLWDMLRETMAKSRHKNLNSNCRCDM